MDRLLHIIMARGRMTLTSAVLLALAGLGAWFGMPRQEDPDMPDYWGRVLAVYPGADAETVERLILLPIEDHLAEVEELAEVTATAMNERVTLHLELRPGTEHIERVWDDVEDALAAAAAEFPEGAHAPTLNDQLNDQDSVVLAVTGSADPLALKRAADHLKDVLLALDEVAEVKLVADPGEQVTITLDDARAKRLGLDSRRVAAALGARGRNLPGGSIQLAGRAVNLKPHADFADLDEIRRTPLVLDSGAAVPLSQVAGVHHGPDEPAAGIMRYNGARAVGLGIVPRELVHLEAFGEAVRTAVAEAAPGLAPLEISFLTYQPARVTARLQALGNSLLLGIAVVAAILLLFMGPRLGLVVSSVLPLVAFASLAIFAWSGGRLQQMSIAALVIALGMLVDNAIVMAEAVQWRIDHGDDPTTAAVGAVRELAIPLASATATTLAAFVPMLLADGVTADFTRDLPIVIMLTLTMSYLFAVVITPKLGTLWMRRRAGADDKPVGAGIAAFAIRRPWWILAGAVLAVAASLAVAGRVKQQFFPASDRNQLLVELKLPEGAHLDTTDAAARRVERELARLPQVVSVAGFIGRSAPHFYYNVSQVPWSPHFGQILVTTHDAREVADVIHHIRAYAAAELPECQVIPRRLEQGPPVDNPVEVRLFGHDLDSLHRAADIVLAELRTVPGTVDTRHDLSLGAPAINFDIDDAAAARAGISRADVAAVLYGRTRGLPVGQFRGGEDPVPVLLRSAQGEHLSPADLEAMEVGPVGGKAVPVAQVARLSLEIRPAALKHRDRVRVATVSAQLEDDVAFNEVMADLAPRIAALQLPEDVHYSFGGLGEGSSEANNGMAMALPFGLLLLFGILLLEFNSFRKVGIVLTTVPLAATGVIPGLLLSGRPFGFMSFLGVISLIGIVVNNAIVLLDVIDTRLAEGHDLEDAVHAAVARRTRPILLTTLTTVAGLLPLALGGSSMWPPLAWAIISGLIASTALTLLVVPALYLVLFRPRGRQRGLVPPAATAVASLILAVALGLGGTARAQDTVTLEQAMQAAVERGDAMAGRAQAEAADAAAAAEHHAAYRPMAGVQGVYTARDEAISLDTPLGAFNLGERRSSTLDVQVTQPLWRTAAMRYGVPAAAEEARAAGLRTDRTIQALKAEAAQAYLALASIDARLVATDRFIASLDGRLAETRERVRLGRALEVDALKLQLSLARARQDHLALTQARTVGAYRLGRSMGRDQAVFPADTGTLTRPLPDLDTALADAPQQRADVAALMREVAAADLRARAVGAEALPELDLGARYGWSRDDAFRSDDEVVGSLTVRWKPYAAGTRKPRRAAARLKADALRARLAEARAGVRLEVRRAYADLETARGALAVARTSVQLAEETLRVERARHEAGRITTNDLVDAETALRDQHTRLAVADTDATGAAVALLLALDRL